MDRCGHRYRNAEALLHRQGIAAYGKARPGAWDRIAGVGGRATPSTMLAGRAGIQTAGACPLRSVSGYALLLHRLYHHRAAIPNPDAQVVPIQEQHTHQGRGVGGVGLYAYRFTVP